MATNAKDISIFLIFLIFFNFYVNYDSPLFYFLVSKISGQQIWTNFQHLGPRPPWALFWFGSTQGETMKKKFLTKNIKSSIESVSTNLEKSANKMFYIFKISYFCSSWSVISSESRLISCCLEHLDPDPEGLQYCGFLVIVSESLLIFIFSKEDSYKVTRLYR